MTGMGQRTSPLLRERAARGAGASGTDGVIKRAGYGDGPGALSFVTEQFGRLLLSEAKLVECGT